MHAHPARRRPNLHPHKYMPPPAYIPSILHDLMASLRLPVQHSLDEWVDWVMSVAYQVAPAELAEAIGAELQLGGTLSELVASTALKVLAAAS